MNFSNYSKVNLLFVSSSNQGFNVRLWSVKTLCLIVLVFSYLVMFGCGQKKRVWINTEQSGPSPRDDHEIVYDDFHKKIVLFGGWDGGEEFEDTWEWDGQKWNIISSSGPGPRISHGMTYDNSRKKVVLFGGRNSELLGDTWEWDGSNWKQASNSGPPARCDHAMTYDRTREVTVLFGGLGGGLGAIIGGEELTAPKTVEFKEQGFRTTLYGRSSEACKWFGGTWEWNGQSWEKKSDLGPGVRYNHAMAYDSKRKKVILFGGIGEEGKLMGDTWEWDGQSWQEVSNYGPESRFGHTLVYDEISRKVILFGGSNSQEIKGEYEWSHIFDRYQTTYSIIRSPMEDIWEWDGITWEKSEYAGPPARYFHSMSFDAAHGRIVLFGGHGLNDRLGDTWEYRRQSKNLF
jgi:hypothetical protein